MKLLNLQEVINLESKRKNLKQLLSYNVKETHSSHVRISGYAAGSGNFTSEASVNLGRLILFIRKEIELIEVELKKMGVEL